VRCNTDEDLQMKMQFYLARTDPADVARVESKTFISTPDRYQTEPRSQKDTKSILGNWMSPDQLKSECQERFPGCMEGRIMYVIPFSMGPIGSPLSKIGIELTDSNYVVMSMRIMTRVSSKIWDVLRMNDGRFVKCVHSIGSPRPVKNEIINHWPCNPEKTMILHIPQEWKIMSYGSGYGGNSLLGKKCFALRIASTIARDEGWLAEHMLIMCATNPNGEQKFIAAAFPSGCGKTNMAMMLPSIPGWKVEVIGDDIAWLKFNSDGKLHAINPENGFFGIAPGTNRKTNPIAMDTVQKNTIFTNVGKTSDGGVFWEGLEKEVDKDLDITTWKNEEWRIGNPGKAAHPNSRFCCPIAQCPAIHPKWQSKEGVPIDAIVFGGRRPYGVPLIYETFNWSHGVMVGATIKSEATAAAEHRGKQIMHDPMAMRPFMGYNFGKYLQHWLDIEKKGRQMPKVFHVNWFRVDENGKFLWPGFGENIRVVDWMFRRIDGEKDIAKSTPLGLVPVEGSLNYDGLDIDHGKLFDLPRSYLKEDISESIDWLEKQCGIDLPGVIHNELISQKNRIDAAL